MSLVGKILREPDILGVVRRIAESGPVPVAAEKRLCQNFRWKKSCSICADVCPVSAVELGALKIDRARCVGCGVCVRVCPAGALTFEARGRKALMADAGKALGRGGTVTFCCDRCGGALGKTRRARGSVAVPCLAMLDESVILECHARGAKNVRLVGCSPRCSFVRGRRIHKQTLRMADAIMRAVRLDYGAGRAGAGSAPESGRGRRDGGAEGPDGQDRREFLARAGRGLIEAAYPDERGAGKPDRWTWMHRLPERRAELLKLIKGPAAGRRRISRSGGMQFAEVRADPGRCSMCGACGALCPTGAIGTVELDDSSLLYFNFAWCTGCLLCVRACPERALAAGGSVEPGRLAGPGGLLLKMSALRCPECGTRSIPARTGGQCPRCAKAQATLGPARWTAGR